MGSFWGHADGAIFFMLLSLWWMVNIFVRYIKREGRTEDLRLPMTFGGPVNKNWPIEIFFKTGFPLFGFIAEVVSRDYPNFVDENGRFVDMVNLQHMGLYGLFVIHGLIDLCLWYRIPMIKNAHLMSVSLAFMWYGIGFYFHSNMPGKEPLEAMVHIAIIPILLLCALCPALLIAFPKGVAIRLTFAFCTFTLSTWFMHTSFILYKPSPFPGREPSNWDRNDHRNVACVVGLLGAHLCFNLIFTTVFYIIIYVIMVHKNWATPFTQQYYSDQEEESYQKLPDSDPSENCFDDSLVEVKA